MAFRRFRRGRRRVRRFRRRARRGARPRRALNANPKCKMARIRWVGGTFPQPSQLTPLTSLRRTFTRMTFTPLIRRLSRINPWALITLRTCFITSWLLVRR